ncbi:MAG: zinc-binding dehydrogenase [Desulfobacterales bacterium]|nr:zinc-binding dehydrogenase [Desulfobacterales bacterium]
MKKAVYHGIKDVRIEDVDEPNPSLNEIKIKVKYCGICGSDKHEYIHGPFPITCFGHEACGTVVETGKDVIGFQKGDRVLAVSLGGFAQYMTAPQERVTKIPDGLTWEKSAVLEPFAGAVYAVKKGDVKAHDTVLITGAGAVGLMLLLAVKSMGVETVYMTDISSLKQEMAKKLGASDAFNPINTKIPQKIRELTGGRGVDVAIEAVGIQPSLKDCLASTCYQGTVIVQGIFTERVPVHMLGFVTNEMRMIGTNNIDVPQAIDWMLTKYIHPESIITSIISLDDIIHAGLEGKDPDSQIKILVAP